MPGPLPRMVPGLQSGRFHDAGDGHQRTANLASHAEELRRAACRPEVVILAVGDVVP